MNMIAIVFSEINKTWLDMLPEIRTKFRFFILLSIIFYSVDTYSQNEDENSSLNDYYFFSCLPSTVKIYEFGKDTFPLRDSMSKALIVGDVFIADSTLLQIFHFKNVIALYIVAPDITRYIDLIAYYYPDLKYLGIEQFNNNVIPGNIKKLKNLEFLSLRKNHLTCFPNQILELYNLNTLILGRAIQYKFENNKIDSIPSDLNKLKNLKVLVANSVNLKSISTYLNLEKLEYLDLSSNLILEVEFKLLNNMNINYMDLSKNELTKINFEGMLFKLQYLNLNYNSELVFKDEFFIKTPNISDLRVDFKSSCIPNSMFELSKLKSLNLHNAAIKSAYDFKYLKNLRKICLYSCKISNKQKRHLHKMFGDKIRIE